MLTPVEPTKSLVEGPGFTLVEEDDVAFSLRLCREVHRIYGEYQDGRLQASDPVLAGLVVTVEMLAALSRSVRDGMPGMRITVAAAQTREMLAVIFGQDPLVKPLDRRRRDRYRSIVAEAARASGAPALPPVTAVPDASPVPAPVRGRPLRRLVRWRRR